MKKESKETDFDQLRDPFQSGKVEEITPERILQVAKNPALLSEMDLIGKLRFTAEAMKLMVSSEELRNQVFDILKERTISKNE